MHVPLPPDIPPPSWPSTFFCPPTDFLPVTRAHPVEPLNSNPLAPSHRRLLQYTPHLHHYITRFYSPWVVIGEHSLKRLGKVASPRPLGMPTCGSTGGVEYSVALVVIRYLDSDSYRTCRVSPRYSPYIWHVHHKNSALRHNKIDSHSTSGSTVS